MYLIIISILYILTSFNPQHHLSYFYYQYFTDVEIKAQIRQLD